MILKEINSSLATFKNIKFKKGVNIIIGTHSEDKSKSQSFNGVGKSLTGRIINYCLGSKDENLEEAFDRDFKEHVSFNLIFELNNIYDIKRYVTGDKNIKHKYINGENYNDKHFSSFLKELFFSKESPNLRSLIHYFFRNQKQYEDYIIKSRNSYNDILPILYLMEIDIAFMNSKQLLVKQINELSNDKNYFKNRLKSEDNKLAIKNIEDEIKNLEKKIAGYEVAKEYEKEASKLKTAEEKHKELIEEKYDIEYSKRQAVDFLNSLNKDSMTGEYITKMYEEAGFFFADKIQKELNLVKDFHNNLYENRKKRLNETIVSMNKKIEDIESKILKYGDIIDTLTGIIDKNGIMNEYSSIRNNLEHKRMELNDLKNNKKEFDKISLEIDKKEKELESLITELEAYYDKIKNNISEVWSSNFRTYLTKIYDQPDGMITIKENKSMTAQTAFDIEVEVEHDGSDGRKQVGIFVFDWLLLLYGRHNINCLYHDNRLYQAVDGNMCSKMIKLSEKWCEENNKQYILCLDLDKYEAMTKDNKELKELIDRNTIIMLRDTKTKNGEEKLLGINMGIKDKK